MRCYRRRVTSTELRNLEILALFIRIDVKRAIEAAVVTTAARMPFQARPSDFFTNPANTFVYAAMDALEERSIVAISEIVENQARTFELATDIRRRADLVRHRHVLSHPATVRWQKQWMQEFTDDDRQYLDVRPALVWDLQRSVNERLRELGGSPRPETIDVLPGMAIAVRDIWRLSMTEAAQRQRLPSEPDVMTSLVPFRDRFLDFLIRHPDGQTAGNREHVEQRRASRTKK